MVTQFTFGNLRISPRRPSGKFSECSQASFARQPTKAGREESEHPSGSLEAPQSKGRLFAVMSTAFLTHYPFPSILLPRLSSDHHLSECPSVA